MPQTTAAGQRAGVGGRQQQQQRAARRAACRRAAVSCSPGQPRSSSRQPAQWRAGRACVPCMPGGRRAAEAQPPARLAGARPRLWRLNRLSGWLVCCPAAARARRLQGAFASLNAPSCRSGNVPDPPGRLAGRGTAGRPPPAEIMGPDIQIRTIRRRYISFCDPFCYGFGARRTAEREVVVLLLTGLRPCLDGPRATRRGRFGPYDGQETDSSTAE